MCPPEAFGYLRQPRADSRDAVWKHSRRMKFSRVMRSARTSRKKKAYQVAEHCSIPDSGNSWLTSAHNLSKPTRKCLYRREAALTACCSSFAKLSEMEGEGPFWALSGVEPTLQTSWALIRNGQQRESWQTHHQHISFRILASVQRKRQKKQTVNVTLTYINYLQDCGATVEPNR